MKQAVFIGNRSGVWQTLRSQPDINLVLTLLPPGCPLSTHPELHKDPHHFISNRKSAVEELKSIEFDLLVSNGCPYILPVSSLRKAQQLFVNIHPSLLPDLRGKHPANAALLFELAKTGVTMHFMEDEVDSGGIIAQKELPISPDLDLGLLYYSLFALEAEVFIEGMEKLRANDFHYTGEPQQAGNHYYSRTDSDLIIDIVRTPRSELLRRIRAFGVASQGVRCQIEGKPVVVFDAEPVDNSFLVSHSRNFAPGEVVLRYDEKILVRCLDGLVKIKAHRPA